MGIEGQKVYIIGAGISGLTAAIELEKAGYDPVILERSNGVGGRVRTLEINGYALDIGFQVLLDAYPNAKKYLDLPALKLDKLASGAMIYADNRAYVIGDPLRNMRYLMPVLFAQIGSFGDKLKILKLNRALKKKSIDAIFSSPETTTLQYLRDFGFSEKMIERFFRPFFTGIFLETQLDTSSRMFEFVYKMFGEGYATIPKMGIGAIAEQMKSKLGRTQFRFETNVTKIDGQQVHLDSGEILEHQGVIIATEADDLIENLRDSAVQWKSCQSLYFEIDKTNIPEKTIALIPDSEAYTNNVYAFRDHLSGKRLVSATIVKEFQGTPEALQKQVESELLKYIGCKKLTFVHSFDIQKALPNLKNLRTNAEPNESEILPNVHLAGDTLFNGSLNAAMQSGQLAAQGFIEKQQGFQS
jgi:phytoene dehydrogenase-like protein